MGFMWGPVGLFMGFKVLHVSNSIKGSATVGSSSNPELEQGGRGRCSPLKGSIC